MDKRILQLGLVVLLALPGLAGATLISKLGGQVVYDTDLDITWLANANLAATNSFGVSGVHSNGTMTWYTATNSTSGWIAGMNTANYLGYNDWRLPTTQVPDTGCTNALGWGCTDSEMGHLFYNELGATRLTSVLNTGIMAELEKFTNVQPSNYWSGTEVASFANLGWRFNFSNGGQRGGDKTRGFFAWAVRSGDVAAPVPEPSTLALLGLGLAVIGFGKRSKRRL